MNIGYPGQLKKLKSCTASTSCFDKSTKNWCSVASLVVPDPPFETFLTSRSLSGLQQNFFSYYLQWIQWMQYINNRKYCFFPPNSDTGTFYGCSTDIDTDAQYPKFDTEILVFPVFYSISILFFNPIIDSYYLRLLSI